MFCRFTVVCLVAATLGLFINERSAAACPFCAAVSQTFSEEMGSMDAVVIARLVDPPADSSDSSSEEVPKAKFKVEKVIKGDSLLGNQQIVETIFFGDAKKGDPFLIMGVDPPNLMWSTPLQLTERGQKYVSRLTSLPEKGADRLAFFQDYLEDEDEMLARDAYDEFAKAPYSEVIDLKDRMKYERLIEWIKSEDVPASRRRLYLTMLGVCGSTMDLQMLEEMLKSTDRKKKAGLDAMIGCYLTLKGADGMPLVEDLFLKNKDAEYADTYAAIMALRFHGGQTDIIPRPRILKGLHHMLERPQLADLVIPDLAKWEDWSVMDKLVQLFKEADEKSSWVRVPVINYLRACPLPEAKKHIEDLEKIDPAAVKRAKTFFPYSSSEKDGEKTSSWQRPNKDRMTSQQLTLVSANGGGAVPVNIGDQRAVAQIADSSVDQLSLAIPPAVVANQAMNSFLMLGVAILAGSGMFLLRWSILRGAGRPTSA